MDPHYQLGVYSITPALEKSFREAIIKHPKCSNENFHHGNHALNSGRQEKESSWLKFNGKRFEIVTDLGNQKKKKVPNLVLILRSIKSEDLKIPFLKTILTKHPTLTIFIYFHR